MSLLYIKWYFILTLPSKLVGEFFFKLIQQIKTNQIDHGIDGKIRF